MRHIELLGGCHIRDALSEALIVATKEGEAVTFDFNGVKHMVEPGEAYEAAKQRAEQTAGFEILTADEESARARRSLEETEAKTEAAIAAAGVPTEAEMRDAEVPRPKSLEELTAYIESLTKRPHDYGTCVYAMSHAAVAAFNFVSHELGVTGFQASCADMDILSHTRGWKWGRLLDYDNLLYPQYCSAEHFPGWQDIVAANRDKLAERARAKLAENGHAAPAVEAHWRWLAEGNA